MRIAAIGDVHTNLQGTNNRTELYNSIGQFADVLVLCGDLTDTGHHEEAARLAEALHMCRVPVIAVLGNHDYELNQETDISEVLKAGGCHVLQGETYTIEEVSFVGTKGFGGGFDNRMLSSWGEPATKAFVQEAVNEALLLDSVLSHTPTAKKAVLMHYSPVRDTVVGENEEVFPFLGCSRLAEPLDRRQVNVCFHGHAHHGTFEGKTLGGVPVFNVSAQIVEQRFAEQKCFIYEL